MKLPTRFCLALVVGLALAGHASAQVDLSVSPHLAEPFVVPDGSTSTSAVYVMTLAHDSTVTINVGVRAQAPFSIGGQFDTEGLQAPPLHSADDYVWATFVDRLGAGQHAFETVLSLPWVASGPYMAASIVDFSAVPVPVVDPGSPSAVPEPGSPALMLLGGLGLLGSALRRRRAHAA